MTSLLDSLLAPIDAETFFRDTFGKKHLHVKGTPERTAAIMTLGGLNSLMSMTSVWSPQTLKLFVDRNPVPVPEYCAKALALGGEALRPDPDKVQDWIGKGASVILNDIDALAPGVRQLANELQEATGGRSQANLYFSMSQHQAFGPHCDVHEVFAVHCNGEKVWNIYESREDTPINHPSFNFGDAERERRAGKVAEQVLMQPGDLLYIPRGLYHDALASENGALHIAFGVTLPKPLDLLAIIWEAAVQDPELRADLPHKADGKTLEKLLKKMGKKVEAILSSKAALTSAAQAVESWPYEFKSYDLESRVKIPCAPAPQAASEGENYRVSKKVRVVQQNGRPILTDGKQHVEVPGDIASQVSFIMSRDTVSAAALKTQFPEMTEAAVAELIQNMKAMRAIG
ncbi:JmjC domain-containing protein [Pelagibius marinus]|uniref:JmjC domain-containing protein n=1 Tax=Pelagibius marinus TaxID=2762760 RepID=UPI001872CE74|nr:cupin domain-containing protein [Pelagibius marinus]